VATHHLTQTRAPRAKTLAPAACTVYPFSMRLHHPPLLLLPLLCLLLTRAPMANAENDINYDEEKIPAYTLPDPLVATDGSPVATADQWRHQRRPELLQLFEREVYGRTPVARPPGMTWKTVTEKKDARNGRALRREIEVNLFGLDQGPVVRLLVHLPASATPESPCPVFLGLNFEGNHATTTDPDIPLPSTWVPANRGANLDENTPSEKTRGVQADRWLIDLALARGCGVATAYYGEFDPDFDDGFKNGIHAVTGPPADGDWGSIGTWAWGLSRLLDVLEKEPGVHPKKIIAMGHSRLGKTALWAGAQDDRFAAVISNNSGCGGAALSRRALGETVARINKSFPHWFTSGYKKWNGRENDCPVDQHQLIALIAPRPVLVTSATEDRWADPKGEFLSLVAANPVYRLLGTTGLAQTTQPPPDQLLNGPLAYLLRSGPHDVTATDWQAYLDFAASQLP